MGYLIGIVGIALQTFQRLMMCLGWVERPNFGKVNIYVRIMVTWSTFDIVMYVFWVVAWELSEPLKLLIFWLNYNHFDTFSSIKLTFLNKIIIKSFIPCPYSSVFCDTSTPIAKLLFLMNINKYKAIYPSPSVVLEWSQRDFLAHLLRTKPRMPLSIPILQSFFWMHR